MEVFICESLIILLIIGSLNWLPKKLYEKSDYYKQTRNSFHSMRFNKGIRGEFLIWKYLQKLSGYKKYLFNCYLPKKNAETTEIDVILLHESGIYVFESQEGTFPDACIATNFSLNENGDIM